MMSNRGIASVLGAALALVACRPDAPRHFAAAETLAPKDASTPAVVVDARSGTVYVAWAAMTSDSQWNVVLASQAPGQPFGAPVRVNPAAGEVVASGQFPPQVELGASGTVLVSWLAAVNDVVQVRVARSQDGGATFAAPVTLGATTNGPQPSLYYDMAAGPDGHAWVAWLDLGRYAAADAAHTASKDTMPMPDVEADLRVATSSDDGRSFGSSVILDSTSCICCRTAVVGGPQGAMIAWRHVYPVNLRDIVVGAPGAGGAAPAFARVHEDKWQINGCPEVGPDLAVGTDRGVHVVWYTGAEGRQGLYYAESPDGGKTFGEPVAVRAGPGVTPSTVKVALSGSTPWLFWEEGDTTGTRLRLGHIAGGRLVAEPDTVGQGATPAMASGGTVIGLAWEDHGAVRVRVSRPEGP